MGTPIADAIGRDSQPAREALQYLVFHNIMEFTNSDFRRCDVTGTEQGILQLREGDSFTAALNVGAATRHPQWEYRTVAGDRRSPDFESIDALLGVFVDDGIVNTISANASVIGGVQFAVSPQDHSRIVDSEPGLSIIMQFLQF